MNRYELKKRQPLFLSGCRIKLSKEGMALIRKQKGGFTPKWFRDKTGTILTINEFGEYMIAWEMESLPGWKSSIQVWHDSRNFIHYRPRRKSL